MGCPYTELSKSLATVVTRNRLDYIYKHENSKMASYSNNSSKQAWFKGSIILVDQPPSSFPSKKWMLRSE